MKLIVQLPQRLFPITEQVVRVMEEISSLTCPVGFTTGTYVVNISSGHRTFTREQHVYLMTCQHYTSMHAVYGFASYVECSKIVCRESQLCDLDDDLNVLQNNEEQSCLKMCRAVSSVHFFSCDTMQLMPFWGGSWRKSAIGIYETFSFCRGF